MLDRIPNPPAGLLRRGSPVCNYGAHRLVSKTFERAGVLVGIKCEGSAMADHRVDDFALDLTDPTGRAHLAWWIGRQPDYLTLFGYDPDDQAVVRSAVCGADMTPAEINTLARLALRMMGRAECAP